MDHHINDHYIKFAADEQIKRCLPGFLYFLDIADFKTRNGYVGHAIADADISDLNSLLEKIALDKCCFKRVEGDKWLFLSNENHHKKMEEVITAFSKKEDPYEIGWILTSSKEKEIKTKKYTINSFVRRALRCIYTQVTTQGQLIEVLQHIRNVSFLPVNKILSVEESITLREVNKDSENWGEDSWKCISTYPLEHPTECLLCGEKDFNWLKGYGFYDSEASCKNCKAEHDVRDISIPLKTS